MLVPSAEVGTKWKSNWVCVRAKVDRQSGGISWGKEKEGKPAVCLKLKEKMDSEGEWPFQGLVGRTFGV